MGLKRLFRELQEIGWAWVWSELGYYITDLMNINEVGRYALTLGLVSLVTLGNIVA